MLADLQATCTRGQLRRGRKMSAHQREIAALKAWLFNIFSRTIKDVEDVTGLSDLSIGVRLRTNNIRIPGEVRHLASLRSIHLKGQGRMTIDIPPEIVQLKELKTLTLEQFCLSSFPQGLTAIRSLRVLDLYGNELEGIPEDIKNLSLLQDIDLSSNSLQTVPEGLMMLPSLTYLDISMNALTSLPPMQGLKALKTLQLHSNSLTEIPEDIGHLRRLKNLYLRRNKLSTIPAEIQGAKSLETLDIRDNPLTRLPMAALGKLPKLRYLRHAGEWTSLFCIHVVDKVHLVKPSYTRVINMCRRKAEILQKNVLERDLPVVRMLHEQVRSAVIPDMVHLGKKGKCPYCSSNDM